jgi:hypothetical protein
VPLCSVAIVALANHAGAAEDISGQFSVVSCQCRRCQPRHDESLSLVRWVQQRAATARKEGLALQRATSVWLPLQRFARLGPRDRKPTASQRWEALNRYQGGLRLAPSGTLTRRSARVS